jgi:UDP-glucose 4-epimerase
MDFLVTGGAGFIGSNLVEELIHHGKVVVVDDLSTGNQHNLKNLDIKLHKKSILELPVLLELSKNIDCIFHQAALPNVSRSIEDPMRSNEINVKGTLNILEAARRNNVKKVVYASSSSIYGDSKALPKTEKMKPNPLSPYAVTKLTGEYYCRVYNHVFKLPTVCLRYFNVYGPKQDPSGEYAAVVPKFITRALDGKPPVIYGDGTQTRDCTYVKDVVQANIKAFESSAEGIFNVSYGERISIKELAKKVTRIIGNEPEIRYDKPRLGDIKHSLGDITKARKELGYKPDHDIDKGLEETINWFRKNWRN